ncbi:hypothetical protein LEMA_P019470.1 [Plenodomus lingam JN3]|uniref:Uncharacterized protein n=1 Tax=Leptosphaeria maculans (strain JN3 / isolate v23.1.3 / race Av1-4-5-6-7-8) TaxID=985895 RepID=E5AAX6_LEPMJ|nr:hypothetical protein LEMA_P019470.1 [Plenodomus lingam JN3]CBY00817.1 hypothetical protein LEMA_P019470.1 [Plenodomus lingam JN3]
MPIPRYEYNGPIDHTIPIDYAQLKGKSVIITGGANGMGETCVRRFAESGAYVTIADLNKCGYELSSELNQKYGDERTTFVRVDIRDWDQQKNMFEAAMGKFGAVDIVIANAGISRSSGDSLWALDDPNGDPTKPDLNIVEVNLRGSFYTWKLAVHYWRKQQESEDRDRCFIITGSMVAWIDSPVRALHGTKSRLLIQARGTGSTRPRSMVCMASCAQPVDPRGSKASASTMLHRLGSRARFGQRNMSSGLSTVVSNSGSRTMLRVV